MSRGVPIKYGAIKRKSFKRYQCRCRKCKVRFTLTKHPDFYIRLPRCCKDRDIIVDWYRTSKTERKRFPACKCLGMPYPHRRTSCDSRVGGMCEHSEAHRLAISSVGIDELGNIN